MKEKLLRKIRELISVIGLDYCELAVLIDASEKSIYKWVAGKSLPSCAHFYSLTELAKAKTEEGTH